MNMNRRQFGGVMVVGGTVIAMGGLEGCTTDQLQSALDELNTWVPVALVTFDGVMEYVNPPVGSILLALRPVVDGEWKALSAALATYIHTVPPPANGLDTVVAIMVSLEENLTQITDALPPGIDANILAASKAAFALLLATLEDIQRRLNRPAPASIRAAARVAAAGVAPAKSKKDFVAKVNKIMAQYGQPLRVKA